MNEPIRREPTGTEYDLHADAALGVFGWALVSILAAFSVGFIAWAAYVVWPVLVVAVN